LTLWLGVGAGPVLAGQSEAMGLVGDDLSAWRQDSGSWLVAGEAKPDPTDPERLTSTAGGGVLVNGPDGRTSNLLSRLEHGDVEAHVEFMVPEGSNSGVYFQGRYEVQVLDSWGVEEPKHSDCGGIYQRWKDDKGFEGHPPRTNASRPPGQWQSFDVVFRAPRFDGAGRKTANARFERVLHNGVLVHEDVEVTGPTRAASFEDERPLGPLMLQGDHGPVAYRNITLRPLDESGEQLRVMSFNVRYGAADDGENSWKYRKDLVVETVRAFGPDLLGTQETLDFQAEYLLEQLDGYSHVGWPREPQGGEQCAILFRQQRFEKRDAGQFALSETPDVPGSKGWDAAFARIVTWVRLHDRRAGADLVFINTHFDHRGAEARLESARLLRTRLPELAPDDAWILTGDFNAAEASPPYEALVGAHADGPSVIDAYRAIHPERAPDEGTFNGFSGERSGGRIDWVLHSPRFETLEASIDRTERDRRFPSDHFPVTAVLAWND
jgi:endonuclease/exonuclease/phosphatase family metal-dependent hydrolase